MNIITKLLARFRERSDRKFRERIGRIEAKEMNLTTQHANLSLAW